MSRPLSKVLRESSLEGVMRWGFWCPGCRCPHYLPIVKPPGTTNKGPWLFTGELDAPTIAPSVHVTHDAIKDPITGEVLGPAGSLCHSIITAGRITFLDDSHGHKLRGTHDLPPYPHPEELPPLPNPLRMFSAENRGPRKWRAV